MKYLCLVYGEEQAIQAVDDRHCVAFDESIRKSEHGIASEALQPVSTATTVRVRETLPFRLTEDQSRALDEPCVLGRIFWSDRTRPISYVWKPSHPSRVCVSSALRWCFLRPE